MMVVSLKAGVNRKEGAINRPGLQAVSHSYQPSSIISYG